MSEVLELLLVWSLSWAKTKTNNNNKKKKNPKTMHVNGIRFIVYAKIQ